MDLEDLTASFERVQVGPFGFNNATPTLIFEHVFAYLSPGFLWIFVRPVCKAWKEAVDQYIVRSVYSKGLIQIIMTAQKAFDNDDDINYRIHNTIYQCTNFEKDTFTFTPFKNWEPYSIQAWLENPKGDRIRQSSWRVLDIISSVLPVPWRPDPAEYYQKKDAHHLDYDGNVILYYPQICHNDKLTQLYIDQFHAQPSVKEPAVKTPLAVLDLTSKWLTYSCFQSPDVYLELRFGKYLFKCRYLTQLILKKGELPGKNWQQHSTLIIDKVEVELTALFSWICTCPSNVLARHGRCPKENLLGGRGAPPPSLLLYPQHVPQLHACTFSPVIDSKKRKAFPYFPCSDRDKWKTKVERFGDAALSSFFLPDLSSSVRRHLPKNPNRPCQGCISKTPNINNRKYIINSAARRCQNTRCGKCCTDQDCIVHAKGCFACQERKRRKGQGPPCVNVFKCGAG